MPRISNLPEITNVAADDEIAVRDTSASTTKRLTMTRLKEWLQSLTGWITASNISHAPMVDAGNGWKYDPITRTYYYTQDNVPAQTRNGNGTSGDQGQFGASIYPPTGFSDFNSLAVAVTASASNFSQVVSSIRINGSKTEYQVWTRNVWNSATSTGTGKISATAKLIE